eukprot:3398045-Amphidinium_carterae.2
MLGKYFLRPWDWGGVGIDPRFLKLEISGFLASMAALARCSCLDCSQQCCLAQSRSFPIVLHTSGELVRVTESEGAQPGYLMHLPSELFFTYQSTRVVFTADFEQPSI